MGLLLYPYFLLAFWYRDFFPGTLNFSLGILSYTANLLSVPLLIKTFLKPLKNEYREGLVLFSIAAGVAVKTIILLVAFIILLAVLFCLVVLNILVFLLPVLIIRFVILI